jgi:glutamyl-tRNA(Gln) amidotransferase subunit D
LFENHTRWELLKAIKKCFVVVYVMKLKEFYKKNKLEEGMLVEFSSKGSSVAGTIIPSLNENLMVKMNTGYNAGFDITKIKDVKSRGKAKGVGKAKKKAFAKNSKLPTISILHTGGTIASRVDYKSGAVYSSFDIGDMLTMFPELTKMANFDSAHIGNMWTDDFRFEHFSLIAKEVEKAYKKGSAGVIISMGTDNMAVASAALSFVLEKCPLPIILVGAQRSSDRGSSDAAMNLICAANFITQSDFAGVAICMHDSTNDINCAILPACKTRKLHTSRRDAFKAVNDTPIALVNYQNGEIKFLKKDYAKKSEEKVVLKDKFENKVALMKISINMFPEQFEFYTEKKFKGLVIEGTGLGHTPGHCPDKISEANKKIFPAIKKFVDSGGVAVMTSTCLFGRVHMHIYNKGTDLTTLGVIPGEDMLPETAFVKLSWLLGNYSKKEASELLPKNLRGEISEFSNVETYEE